MIVLLAGLSACAAPGGRNTTADAIRHELDNASQENVTPGSSEAVDNALLPPLTVQMPHVDNKPLETRFDLTVNHTPASQVFMAIVSGTRYSMLVPPDLTGDISLSLKDVTVFDALEAIHDLYGYEYKVDGTRIYILPASLQTRLFQVNYLTGERDGTSSLRVTSGSLSNGSSSNRSNIASSTNDGNSTDQSQSRGLDSSRVDTKSSTDFWPELEQALKMIIGVDRSSAKDDRGRSVVISPMSGVIVVRAMPDELNNVAAYLKASQLSVDRQVILEAKIIEVQLNDSFQSGVNWAGFGNLRSSPTSRGSFGVLAPEAALAPDAAGGVSQAISNTILSSTPGTSLAASSSAAGVAGSLFGLSFQTDNFAALLNFLESQGSVHVLSSPRIATLNNQKAVLKVGTDEFFVTNVTNTNVNNVSGTTTTPTVTLQPFFSGIALDVTPRIDADGEIILHVHPSVSLVSTVNKTVDTGTGGTLNLPLASSSISETDSIVRARDGQIVAIGGLMRQTTVDDQSGLPGMSKRLFGQTSKHTEKRELVILIKPTVINSDKDWSDDITRSRDSIDGMMNSTGARP